MRVQERPSTAAGLAHCQRGALVRDSLPRAGMLTLPTTDTPIGEQPPGLRLPAGGTKARYTPTTSVWSPPFLATMVTDPVRSGMPGRRRTLAGGLR